MLIKKFRHNCIFYFHEKLVKRLINMVRKIYIIDNVNGNFKTKIKSKYVRTVKVNFYLLIHLFSRMFHEKII